MNLLSLLQQVTSAVPRPEDTIRVQGERPSIPEWTPPPPLRSGDVEEPASTPLMGNRAARENAYEAIGRNPNPRRGLRGLLNQIIGVAGDMGRLNAGMDPLYAQAQERRRVADAMIGWSASPEAARAAAERMAAAGDPAAAREVLDQVSQEELRREQIGATRDNNQAMNQNRVAIRAARYLQNARRVLAAPEAFVNGTLNPEAYRIIQAMGQSEGLTPEDIGVNTELTPTGAGFLSRTDTSLYQNESLKDRDVQLGISQQQADASTTRANRAPAPRTAPNPTNASELARIRGMINRGERLGPGDQATWDAEMRRLDGDAPRSRAASRAQRVTTRSGRTFTPVN